jgi:hypothetical protein
MAFVELSEYGGYPSACTIGAIGTERQKRHNEHNKGEDFRVENFKDG